MDETNETIRVKAVQHYRRVYKRDRRFCPTRMAELAPGVVAVEDRAGECDALFDTKRWKFTHPEIWDKTDDSWLIEAGVDVLPGIGSLPRVSSIEKMVDFAKEHLSPRRKEYSWWHEPRFFDFNKVD